MLFLIGKKCKEVEEAPKDLQSMYEVIIIIIVMLISTCGLHIEVEKLREMSFSVLADCTHSHLRILIHTAFLCLAQIYIELKNFILIMRLEFFEIVIPTNMMVNWDIMDILNICNLETSFNGYYPNNSNC